MRPRAQAACSVSVFSVFAHPLLFAFASYSSPSAFACLSSRILYCSRAASNKARLKQTRCTFQRELFLHLHTIIHSRREALCFFASRLAQSLSRLSLPSEWHSLHERTHNKKLGFRSFFFPTFSVACPFSFTDLIEDAAAAHVRNTRQRIPYLLLRNPGQPQYFFPWSSAIAASLSRFLWSKSESVVVKEASTQDAQTTVCCTPTRAKQSEAVQ